MTNCSTNACSMLSAARRPVRAERELTQAIQSSSVIRRSIIGGFQLYIHIKDICGDHAYRQSSRSTSRLVGAPGHCRDLSSAGLKSTTSAEASDTAPETGYLTQQLSRGKHHPQRGIDDDGEFQKGC